MVQVKPFVLEQWINKNEAAAKHNLGESCAASISLDELAALSPGKTAADIISTKPRLTYGAIRGSAPLRTNISRLYDDPSSPALDPDGIIVTQGASEANFLIFYTLVGPGDHVICTYPAYQQLYSVLESLGAEISFWKLREEQGFAPDMEELKKLLRPNTKMIVINNPNNPTGAIMDRAQLQQLVDIAASQDIIILSDEVYAPLYHSLPEANPEPPPSIISLGYDKTIAVGSMSKAFAMAGIRLGWLATPNAEYIAAFAQARGFTTICSSMVDGQIAAHALSPDVQDRLIERNLHLAKTNLAILTKFVEDDERCSWVKPVAGTTAFIQFKTNGAPVADLEFCTKALAEEGIFFSPGSACFGNDVDFKGYVRIGYVCHTEELQGGLQALRKFLDGLK